MMTLNEIRTAKAEALRFLARVEELEASMKAKKAREDDAFLWGFTRQTAALRRASLDLSHALADLRRPKS